MQKILPILWTLILTTISVFLFTMVFPASSPTLPGFAQSVDDTSTSSHPSTTIPSDPTTTQKQAIEEHLSQMTLEQKVAQMFLVRCPESSATTFVEQYQPAGFVLFARDFADKTREEVSKTIASYQQAAKIPLLIGVDEEGGTVVRASKFKTLRSAPFASPQEVYAQGGLLAIQADTAEKDRFLKQMGINVNFAPVADVSTNASDFMYARTFGQEAAETADYVATVVCTMQSDRIGCVLKHFPGYGSNGDTHTKLITDTRPAESFRTRDFIPFQSGIQQGAGAVLVNHNIVKSFDATNPASLSPSVHQILRDELKFQGVIVTDDLSMSAIAQFTDSKHAAVLAVQAGNDLLLSSDFTVQYQAVLEAVNNGTIPQQTIDNAVRRVLQWKLDLSLIT